MVQLPDTLLHTLLETVAGGDEKAFEELFHQYKQRVYAYAMHFTDAVIVSEEIVQDVFLKLWLHKESLREVERFEAYIYTVTRNLCFDYLKKLAHERAMKLEWGRAAGVSEENTGFMVVYKDYENLVCQALDRLPPQQKLVYILSRHQGQKHEEIAKQLHISRNTVKVHLTKALGTIRNYLDTHLKIIALIISSFFFYH